ncbi:MAG TPA: hypothetical protein VNV63_07930, partial [Nitrospiria bacterium]|nr:hypothetical protein [Nitrospiria bacterium]
APGLKMDPEKTQSRRTVAQKPAPAPIGGQRNTKAVRQDLRLLTIMIEELSRPSTSSEVTLLILRFASEIMNRAVIFLTRREDILGLGQSGLVLPGGGNANERIRNLRIPLAEESIFKFVMGKKLPYKGKLEINHWNEFLVERLGREWPVEVYVTPLINEGRVIAILYGDNLPKQEAIGETEGLETFVKVAAFKLQKPE